MRAPRMWYTPSYAQCSSAFLGNLSNILLCRRYLSIGGSSDHDGEK